MTIHRPRILLYTLFGYAVCGCGWNAPARMHVDDPRCVGLGADREQHVLDVVRQVVGDD